MYNFIQDVNPNWEQSSLFSSRAKKSFSKASFGCRGPWYLYDETLIWVNFRSKYKIYLLSWNIFGIESMDKDNAWFHFNILIQKNKFNIVIFWMGWFQMELIQIMAGYPETWKSKMVDKTQSKIIWLIII